jgi:hypothetical protein
LMQEGVDAFGVQHGERAAEAAPSILAQV